MFEREKFMRRKLFVKIFVTVGLLITAGPALAITYGEPDNGRHPNVGEMIVQTERGYFGVCSGTLIAPDVFLTASHCTAVADQLEADGRLLGLFVTFDEEFEYVLNEDGNPTSHNSNLIAGEQHTNPKYPGNSSDSQDIAVIILDVAQDMNPAELPTAGFLDEIAKKNGLKDQIFTNVGYGVHERQVGDGPIQFDGGDTRMLSTSTFNALNKTWLRLSQNPATEDSGTCYGDSGGPQFFGDDTSNRIVSITITGDVTCQATNDTYRLDTSSAREFLDDYVELP